MLGLSLLSMWVCVIVIVFRRLKFFLFQRTRQKELTFDDMANDRLKKFPLINFLRYGFEKIYDTFVFSFKNTIFIVKNI